MTERNDTGTQRPGATMKRRGLIAGAAMLAAGLLAKQASEPVAANNGDPLILGQTNTATTTTTLSANLSSGGTAFTVSADGPLNASTTGILATVIARTGIGVSGSGPTAGVHGESATSTGVTGNGNDTGVSGTGYNIGVRGSGGAYGVSGSSGIYGVYGSGGIGVYGTGASNGVFGISSGGAGVGGQSTSQVAVYGYSASNAVGVQGQSTNNHGLAGFTDATDGHAGLIGYANNAGGIGLVGNAPGAASPGLAGVFNGDVTINGALRVYGSPKNAAVKHPGDNTYRLLYCEESPESWFADYGRGTLANGTAAIKLDPDFAALVHADDYHVFLTQYDDHNSLYVTNVSPTGFTVQAKEAASPSGVKAPTKQAGGTFSYRVVAKRKDIAGERLAKVAGPPQTQAAKALPAPEMPKTPAPPPKP